MNERSELVVDVSTGAIPSRFRPTRDEVVDAIAISVLMLIAMVGFRSSYGGVEYLIVGMVGVGVGLITGHILARAKLPFLVSVALAVVVYAIVGGVVALRQLTTAGIVPTGQSISATLRAGVFGWKELITTNPPVGDTGTLMVLPFLCGFAAALIAAAVARRTRFHAMAIMPPLIVLGLGIITGVREPVGPLVQGGLFAAVAIAWLAIRHARGRRLVTARRLNLGRVCTAIVLLGVSTAAGFYIAPSLPRADAQERTVWREDVTPPFDPRQYPSPLSGYRRYIKDPSVADAVMFTIEGLPPGVPIRLATMDSYDGLVWRPSYRADAPTTLNSGYFERMGSEIASDFGGQTATVTVTIGDYSDVWVPDVGEVLSLRFEGGPRDELLNEALRYNRATDTAASRVALAEGDRYVMTVRVPPTLEALDGARIDPNFPVGSATNIPAALNSWAGTDAILDIDDVGARIAALRDRLLEEGAYSDGDELQGQAPSAAGHSAFRLKSLVEVEPIRGNAEQYAAAFALMLRGLRSAPSRVVIGFEPDPLAVAAGGAIAVTGSDAEAWVEIPVEALGWVAVDATPVRSEVALKTKSPSPPTPEYETQTPPPPPLLEPEFDSPATSRTGAEDTSEPDDDADDADEPVVGETGGGRVNLVAVGAVGVPMLIAAVGVGTIVCLKLRRRRRRRRAGATHLRIANGWEEATDQALDMGRPVPNTSTRREAAQFIGPAGMQALATRADHAVFAPNEPTDEEVARYWNDLEEQLKSMRRELGPIDRLKAALSVTSLRDGRWRDRR